MLNNKTLYNYFCYAGKLCLENLVKVREDSIDILKNVDPNILSESINVCDFAISNTKDIFDKAELIISQKNEYDSLVSELIDYKFALESCKQEEGTEVLVKYTHIILACVLNNFITEIIEFKTFDKNTIESFGLSFLIEE